MKPFISFLVLIVQICVVSIVALIESAFHLYGCSFVILVLLWTRMQQTSQFFFLVWYVSMVLDVLFLRSFGFHGILFSTLFFVWFLVQEFTRGRFLAYLVLGYGSVYVSQYLLKQQYVPTLAVIVPTTIVLLVGWMILRFMYSPLIVGRHRGITVRAE